MVSCQSHNLTSILHGHDVWLVFDYLLWGIKAIHNGHLEVHYDGSIRAIVTGWVRALAVFEIVAIRVQSLLPVVGLVNLDEIGIMFKFLGEAFVSDLYKLIYVDVLFSDYLLNFDPWNLFVVNSLTFFHTARRDLVTNRVEWRKVILIFNLEVGFDVWYIAHDVVQTSA